MYHSMISYYTVSTVHNDYATVIDTEYQYISIYINIDYIIL